MKPPQSQRLRIALVGQSVGQRGGRRFGALRVESGAGVCGAGDGETPQRRQRGEENANKDRRPRESRKPAGAEPETGPTDGDKETGDDGGRRKGASDPFDQQRRSGQ